eukprot:403353238
MIDILFFGAYIANTVIHGIKLGSDEELLKLYKDRLYIMTDVFQYKPNSLPPDSIIDQIRLSSRLNVIFSGVIAIAVYFTRMIAFLYMKINNSDMHQRRKTLYCESCLQLNTLCSANYNRINIGDLLCEIQLLAFRSQHAIDNWYGNYHLEGISIKPHDNWPSMGTQREFMNGSTSQRFSNNLSSSNMMNGGQKQTQQQNFSKNQYINTNDSNYSGSIRPSPDTKRGFNHKNNSISINPNGPYEQSPQRYPPLRSNNSIVKKLTSGFQSRGVLEDPNFNFR